MRGRGPLLLVLIVLAFLGFQTVRGEMARRGMGPGARAKVEAVFPGNPPGDR